MPKNESLTISLQDFSLLIDLITEKRPSGIITIVSDNEEIIVRDNAGMQVGKFQKTTTP